MEAFQTMLINGQVVFYIIQVLVAIALIAFVLMQQGKGAESGAAFGSGASNTVFGSQGSSNFFTKITGILAAIFLANSLLLAYIAKEKIGAQQSGGFTSVTEVTESTTTTPETVNQEIKDLDVPTVPTTIDDSTTDIPVIPE